MAKSPSCKYSLIPTVEARAGERGPFALMPAVPVILGGSSGIRIYSLLDTAAAVSSISVDTLSELEQAGVSIFKRPMASMATPSGPVVTQTVTVDLALCDEGFNPWLELRSVPFVVLGRVDSGTYPRRIVMGYESCLAQLRIEIDYPNNSLTVQSGDPLKSKTKRSEPQFPARFSEGERLISLGSYGAAIHTIYQALEEAVLEKCHSQGSGGPIVAKQRGLWIERAIESLGLTLSADVKNRLRWLTDLRNRAVHHQDQKLTKIDAESALKIAKEVLIQVAESPSSIPGR